VSVLPESRLSIITLGVRDRAAMTAFYRDVIGFKLFNEKGMTMFDMGGFVLGLWEADKLAEDAGMAAKTG
jgi:catechol 2,3-dioxygenase-like lactoylglutathione lyase family enzyme